MSEIDNRITELNKRLSELDAETNTVQSQLDAAEEEKTKEIEHSSGLTRGDKYRMSSQLRDYLSQNNWWSVLRHGGYDPFIIQGLGENSVYIEDRMGGVCGVPYHHVESCEKITDGTN